MIAHFQAVNADYSSLRATYAQVAEDETRHGQLAWDLHAWFLTRLDPEQWATVEQAQAESLHTLVDRVSVPSWTPRGVGLPRGQDRRALAQRFTQEIAAA